MQRVITVTELKTAEAERRRVAVAAFVLVLAGFARAQGGRYLLFGSAARGTMRFDSDVDLLLDFPREACGAAWDFAETACWDRGLEPDLLPCGGCKPAFQRTGRRDCAVPASGRSLAA
jgi:hypothetical protein